MGGAIGFVLIIALIYWCMTKNKSADVAGALAKAAEENNIRIEGANPRFDDLRTTFGN